jgi:hypothetical protein
MSVQWPEESEYKKILRKWDAPKREGGYNRDGYEPFPRMLYKPQPHPLSGRFMVSLDRDEISLDKTRVIVDAQAFNASCQLVVNDENEMERAKGHGWRETQGEAMAWHEGELDRLAHAAADRNRDDSRMSEKAKAEADAIDRTLDGHRGEIPEQPRMRKPLTEEQRERARANMAKARAARSAKAGAKVVG